jgi:hypothetical protein
LIEFYNLTQKCVVNVIFFKVRGFYAKHSRADVLVDTLDAAF